MDQKSRVAGTRPQVAGGKSQATVHTPQPPSAKLRAASRIRWWILGAVAATTFLVYLPTISYDFVWDDSHLIKNNQYLAQTNPLQIFTKGFWFNPEMSESQGDMAYYRPLTNLSFYFERKEFGLSPTGYHLTNVVIHTVVALLFCVLLLELFGSPWLAGAGGLLLGIHPAVNCVVAFVSNRTYLLALLFLLAGFYSLVRGQRDRRPFWIVLFGLAFLGALFSLEAALVFAALALGWLILRRRNYRDLSLWAAATVLPLIIYFVMRLLVAQTPFASSAVRWAMNEPLRVINTFGQQMLLFLFPFNQKVIYTLDTAFTDFSAYTVLGGLFLILPLLLVIAAKSRRAALGYVWSVFFLLPFAHLLFLGPAGRMLYLSAPGTLILVLALGRRLLKRRRRLALAVLAVGGVYTLALGVQLIRRNPVWHNEFSLYQTMVIDAPDSPGAHLNFGSALEAKGMKDEAVEQYLQAVEISPDYVPPHNRLAFALVDREDLAGAVTQFREVVRLEPFSADARNNLALSLKKLGLLDSAIVEYETSLRLDPSSELTLNNLGSAYLARGDFRAAINVLRQALNRQPQFEAARVNLAEAYTKAGFPDSAAMLR